MKQGEESVNLRPKPDKEDRGKEDMKQAQVEEAKKQLTFYIPADVHKALKMRAAEDEKAISELVEGLIRAYLVGKQSKRT